ncbi:hypothetical protein ACLOJK_000420 [Asimina triloba]
MAAATRVALLLALVAGVLLQPISCSGRALADDCSADMKELMLHCAQYVQVAGSTIPPSRDCCDVVQWANLPCVCQHMPKDAEKVISMAKVVYVAKCCDRPLASGTKCGST